jgi:choline dehydrogenase
MERQTRSTAEQAGQFLSNPCLTRAPLALAMLEGTRSVGIPTFENQNGRMMESAGGSSILDVWFRDGKRQSVFRSYTFPYMDRPSLTAKSTSSTRL